MQFQITTDFITSIEQLIAKKDGSALRDMLHEYHFADIAEILEELDSDDATYIIQLLESDLTSEALMELDDDVREKILSRLSPQEIAAELEELDTDDAADIIAELEESRQQEVIDRIADESHAADIQELLTYDDSTAGALMAKELVRVKETWTVAGCVREMRRQAENVTRVHSIYVTNKEGKLTGRLSLKDLLTASEKTKISEVFIPKVDYVTVHTENEEVARIMQKYDLEAIPVIDEKGILVGRITIDDIVDFIKEEAEKDYQLAAGISQDVEADDSVWQLTRARLPWLFLGMLGGVCAAAILSNFGPFLKDHGILLLFTPLVAAMAGNVGVQSSAIIVQGLANDDVKGSIGHRLFKEMSLAALNGAALAIVLFFFIWSWKGTIDYGLSISISLFVVIIVAGIIGTFIPLFLHKRGIDPAIATGPFITTSNDIFGILIYLLIAKMILGI